METLQQTLYLIADELRGMATIGKYFAGNIYEVERAHRIMELAARVASLADEQPPEIVKAIFDAEPWHRASPAMGVEAFVLNPNHEVLLIQRRDNGRWALPGGIAEIGQTFAEAALRELWEEAGLRGEVIRLLGVFDGRLWESQAKVHICHLVFQVACDDLTPHPGLEALDAAFFAENNLPAQLHNGHAGRIRQSFAAWRGTVYFDPAQSLDRVMPMHQQPNDSQQS